MEVSDQLPVPAALRRYPLVRK